MKHFLLYIIITSIVCLGTTVPKANALTLTPNFDQILKKLVVNQRKYSDKMKLTKNIEQKQNLNRVIHFYDRLKLQLTKNFKGQNIKTFMQNSLSHIIKMEANSETPDIEFWSLVRKLRKSLKYNSFNNIQIFACIDSFLQKQLSQNGTINISERDYDYSNGAENYSTL